MTVAVLGQDQLYPRAAEIFVRSAHQAAERSGRFMAALAGGSTPRPLYELLAGDFREKVPWEKTEIFISDERCVPPDHPDSNFGLIDKVLLQKLNLPVHQIHRMKGELEPRQAADEYETEIIRVFNLRPGQFPVFDLLMLGMGADGHTASIFPGSDVLNETSRLVAAPYVPKLQAHRLTLTPPVLKCARRVLLLVTGAEKADALAHVLAGAFEPETYPAQLLRTAEGEVIWLLGSEAASKLHH